MKAQWLKYYLKIMVCLEIIHIHMSINCRYYWGDCTQLNHNLNKIYTVIRSTLDKTFSHLQIYCYLIVLNTFKISFYSWALSKLFIFYNAHIEHWHPSYKMFLFVFLKKEKKKDLPVILQYLKKIIMKYGQHWVYYGVEIWFKINHRVFKVLGILVIVVHHDTL